MYAFTVFHWYDDYGTMTTTMATAMRWKKNRETPCIAGANATDHSIITPEIIDVASNKLSTARAMPRQPARDKYKRRIAEILEVIMWLATFEGVHNAYVQVHHIMGTTAIMYAFIYLIICVYIYMCVCTFEFVMHTQILCIRTCGICVHTNIVQNDCADPRWLWGCPESCAMIQRRTARK